MFYDIAKFRSEEMAFASSTHFLNDEHTKWVDFYPIPAHGKRVLFDVDEPGVIASFWLTIGGGSSSPNDYLRRLVLRAYWDGEKIPSIEAPVPCFFGSCLSLNAFESYQHYSSALLGSTSGGFNSFIPMPFNKAVIEIENTMDSEVSSLYYIIGYYKLPETSDLGRLHALWRAENPTSLGRPYTILSASGRGHYLGTVLHMKGLSSEKPPKGGLGFLEGNILIYSDGNLSFSSTGTEDYFLSGWYFNRGTFNAPFHGLIFKDEKRNEVLAYRFHIPDPIPFKRNLNVMIHHGEYDEVSAEYESVAYWYQEEPHRPMERDKARPPTKF